mmetsp:Transcript_14801/g.20443  ORF Transcript_14801/g.20443 Transcript_14801/m.20443 type:complete len:283 (-) Transcript_14801:244-1092(-)|eukprot:CAMPEP_0196574236 /NCGR_PEP_ID=MMETSP1081-20130531/3995_1 /TAXON_ID=36882 /ORGANISM="Pyramimonas amylifera, Strain CCMP720" /LENGTH=282 /DNA_ID=CAMNT_0041892199 /DNA_START=161 /DNA_END=1009 /DNA_ORIENTATION=+
MLSLKHTLPIAKFNISSSKKHNNEQRNPHIKIVAKSSFQNQPPQNGHQRGMKKINAKTARNLIKPTQFIGDAILPVIEWADQPTRTDFVAETLLPTTSGYYRVRAYRHWANGSSTEPMAIIYGDVEGLKEIPVRVHDACFTSEVLGSMKCDCAEQLQQSMSFIRDQGPGVVVYLQQEGRGIGLANKIAAYALQEEGYDTVDANRALGLPDDSREYTAVSNMLLDLNIKSIRLMTNNPRKIEKLTALGVIVTGRIPCLIEGNEHSSGYLEAKADRMRHMMDHL